MKYKVCIVLGQVILYGVLMIYLYGVLMIYCTSHLIFPHTQEFTNCISPVFYIYLLSLDVRKKYYIAISQTICVNNKSMWGAEGCESIATDA